MKRLKIHHIDDTRLGLSREVYAAARSEKDARATLSSAIKRVLDRDTIVVADGMNYIKGFRYQLYCEAKAVQTTNCVVHIGTPADKCRELNELALKSSSSSSSSSSSPTTTTTSTAGAEAGAVAAEKKGYSPTLFENLIFRYEEPNGMNRWDSPLFTIPFEDAEGPYEAIWEALIGSSGQAKIVRQNAATVLKPAAEQGYLYELDKTTSEVIAGITGWLQDHAGEGGGEVKVVVGTAAAAEEGEQEGEQEEGGLVVHLPVTAPSLPQLQRLRRQFITLNRQHSLSKARIRHLFVDYLNDSFQS